eukprot:TRINITY_DN6905_c1_g2_i1.p1 TRINITY_DN6905_c1_g2~~TRINITY_DN6905_c1_g2_i1.p1  ORF type:complete len:155 (-),score=21.32 TRINITY_DN6905_c1_g2_i1:233-697(-)
MAIYGGGLASGWVDCYIKGIVLEVVSKLKYDRDYEDTTHADYQTYFTAMHPSSLTKWSGQCFIPENSDDLLRVRISMFNGLSGSPVLVDSLNGPLVIGVVQGHQEAPIEENVAVYVDQPSVRAGLQRIRAQFTRYERHVAVVRNILDVQNNDEL